MFTINKKIACRPSQKHSIEAPKAVKGLAFPEEKSKLFELELAFRYYSPEGWLNEGARIFLPSDAFRHEWNRQVYTHTNGTKFILVPADMVVAVEPESYSFGPTTDTTKAVS